MPERWEPEPRGNKCRVPKCRRTIQYRTKMLCRKCYVRGLYRVKQGFSWDEVLTPEGLELLALTVRANQYTKVIRRPDAPPPPRPPSEQAGVWWNPSTAPTLQSCLTCENLTPLLPRYLACSKDGWPDEINSLAVRAIEQGGLPPALIDYARMCPYYARFRRSGGTTSGAS